MFKPVSAQEAIAQFDEETRSLYSKRQSDERLTTHFLQMVRPTRNHLPVIASPDHPHIQERNAYLKTFGAKLIGSYVFFAFACNQFSKIYFPHGIVLRRSIPSTWAQYVSYRAPIGIVFATIWYYQREYPRSHRIDLTCDSEL